MSSPSFFRAQVGDGPGAFRVGLRVADGDGGVGRVDVGELERGGFRYPEQGIGGDGEDGRVAQAGQRSAVGR